MCIRDRDDIALTQANVRKERFVELAFENKRRWDLSRWRTFHKEFENRVRKGLVPFLDLRTNPAHYVFVRVNPLGIESKTFDYSWYYKSIPGTGANGPVSYTHLDVYKRQGSYKQRWDYMNLHGDLLINLNALFGGYNPDRVYEIIPYIGAGWAHSYSKPHTNAATFNAGIINRFRLSNAVDLNLELSATGLEGKFDGEHGGKPDYDGILGATLGVTYYFPTRGFQRPVPQIISELELRQMRDQMNAMAAANMQLQQQLANAQQPVVEEAEEVVVTDANIAPRTVFFKIGSDKLSPQEEMNLSYLASKMKEFPNMTLSLIHIFTNISLSTGVICAILIFIRQ